MITTKQEPRIDATTENHQVTKRAGEGGTGTTEQQNVHAYQ